MIEQNLKIKPLSVNEAWKGRRYKTDKYKAFEKEVLLNLTGEYKPNGALFVALEFGFSSKLSDIDNPIKMVLDILQKKYGFNDREIVALLVTKLMVPKGNEYIKFKIE